MEVVDGPGAVDREQTLHLVGHRRLGLEEHRVVGGNRVGAEQRCEPVADRRGEHEVAVGEGLHECARTEPVRPVIREVRLAEHVQPGDVAHQVVVNPEATHRVVHGGVDAHGDLVRVLVGDALVHLDEVAVALLDDVLAEPADRVREVEVDAVLQRSDTPACVDLALDRAGGDVAGDEVAERGIAMLEEVVALGLGNLVGGARVIGLRRHPHATVVAKRLAHQRELRLEVVARGDARRVDLREARVRHQRAAPVGPPDRGDVARLGVGREEEDVAVATGAEHDRVARHRLHRAGDEVAGDHADGVPVLEHEVEHLGALVELDVAEVHLAGERLVRAEQELLTGLAPGVERAADLGSTERPVVEQAAVLTGERDALRRALVDDVHAHLRQAVDVRLAGPVVAALDRVVEEAVDAVAVVAVVLRRIDATLRGDAVRAAGGVVEREQLDLVAELAE